MSDYKTLVQKALDTYKPFARSIEKVAIEWLERNLKVDVSDRYRTRAGTCAWTHDRHSGDILSMKVVFGTAVLTEDSMYQTVAHEVAHAVAIVSKQDKGHGWIWQAICKKMGGNGQQYHKLPVVKNKVKRVCIVCDGKPLYVTPKNYEGVKYSPRYTFMGTVQIDMNERKFRWIQKSVAFNSCIGGPKLRSGAELVEG
jgi:hypothetical protein